MEPSKRGRHIAVGCGLVLVAHVKLHRTIGKLHRKAGMRGFAVHNMGLGLDFDFGLGFDFAFDVEFEFDFDFGFDFELIFDLECDFDLCPV